MDPCRLAALALALVAAGTPALTQDAPADDDGQGELDRYQAALESFDVELKAALAARDAGALALLVKLPLRLNHPDGSVTSLANPRALQVGLDAAFPPEVREKIQATTGGDLIRRDMVGYEDGVIWVEDLSGEEEPPRFRVAVVNLPGPDGDRAARVLAFVCDTGKHRVIVEANAEGKARYRSWNAPRSPLGKPDLVLEGSGGAEGTSGCAHFVWTFRADKRTEITVAELGCGEEEPPAGAHGELVVTIGDDVKSSWCY